MAKIDEVKVYSVSDLEKSLGHVSLKRFVQESEGEFLSRTQDIAWHLAWNEEIRIVFVSGPTSSGKTTFSHRLSGATKLYGRDVKVLSMDDYYLDFAQTITPYGLPDYEMIGMLDLDLMGEHIARLVQGEEVELPQFSFRDRMRVWNPGYSLKLRDTDVLLVEGLHALNESLLSHLDPKLYYGIFIMPESHLQSDYTLMNSEDIRILRRTNRDCYHRGANAFSTLDYWPVIRDSEAGFVAQYLERADAYVNSALAYEYLVMPSLVAKSLRHDLELLERHELPRSIYLREVEGGSDYVHLDAVVEQARRYIEVAELLPTVDVGIIPEISILNEFIHR